MSLKSEVKIALINKGWSQRELARQMSISAGYLQDILKEHRNPIERLEQMEEMLGIDLSKYKAKEQVKE